MSDTPIAKLHHQTFESLRHTDAAGNEYWLSRELGKVLDYSEYRHFQPVIERAKEACRNSGHRVEDHFEDVLEMVEIGSGAKRRISEIKVRQTIKELGGTMPENLPAPEKSIKQIERQKKKIDVKKKGSLDNHE